MGVAMLVIGDVNLSVTGHVIMSVNISFTVSVTMTI